MTPRTLLCYGDSNTHGTKPLNLPGVLERFAPADRWPGVLAETLGSGWKIVEEGLPARTTVHDDPIEGRHKNGLAYLRPCLESQLPVDVVVLMLGTNDLKTRFSVTPADIAHSVDVLLETLAACRAGPGGATPHVLLMAPVPIDEVGFLGAIFTGGAAKSRLLAPLYERVAVKHGSAFLDAGEVATVSATDGIHYEADQHHKLGCAVAAIVRQRFGA
ncbi:hydrolase [Paraburkholderia bannensis]|uniref:Lysophospholipase L1 n=1 Tax=Paraburkholderia tropica TaxID=92647 RepID=A0AAQ1GJV4_9BURK|nr:MULTISPECIES: SGNH/GDSL hydrolase family protein [Paraburkholderia]QNB13480.1 SGNH/GDSL hydrolase family protein [Paraburkholderia tropica]RQM47628.1 hydrolase [Paraburkholderia bannensis]RQN38420.1 hydrolase [Paraburkholderia tropica]SEK06408.1 Lysophospholipase L1 [Paraburkholderia tropica]